MSIGAVFKILGGIYTLREGLRGLAETLDGMSLASPAPVKPKGALPPARNEVQTQQKPRGEWDMEATTHFVGDIDGRVSKIIKLIRKGKRSPKIQLAVHKVLNRRCGEKWCIPEKDHKREIEAIFKFVRSQVRYLADPRGVDTYRAPERTMFNFHGGDCDDGSGAIATMLAIALEACGFETRLRVIAVRPQPPDAYSHILVLVGLPQRSPTRWMALDASVDKPAGWYPKSKVSGFKDFVVPP